MAQRRTNANQNKVKKTNLFDFLITVLVAALNKGQLPLMFIGLWILILCFRVPSEDILPFFKSLLEISQFKNVFGWIGFGGVSTVSFYINRRLRRKHTQEIKRISEEKTRLQELVARKNLPSSNR